MSLSDQYPANVTSSGTIVLSNPQGFGTTINNSASCNLSIDYSPGTSGGRITDSAILSGVDLGIQKLNIVIGYNDDKTPIHATYQCYPGLYLKASAYFHVSAPTIPGSYIFVTCGQGGWGGKGNGDGPSTLLAKSFYQIYPCGYVEVGIPGDNGYSMVFSSATTVQAPARVRDKRRPQR